MSHLPLEWNPRLCPRGGLFLPKVQGQTGEACSCKKLWGQTPLHPRGPMAPADSRCSVVAHSLWSERLSATAQKA